MNGMSVLIGLEFLFIICAAAIAIWTSTRPAPDKLWISVILLCIVEAIGRATTAMH
jgi:hypothetical protein